MRISLIVAAGGMGTRFQKTLPKDLPGRDSVSKLFFPLQGRPLLCRTLSLFQKFDEIKETIVAVPRSWESYVRRILRDSGLKSVRTTLGGNTRADSVWNGIRKSDPENEWVMVHDGARPLVSESAVRKILREAPRWDGLVLAKKVVPTVKQCDERGQVVQTLDRRFLYEAETPQLARRKVLEEAYETSARRAMAATDEASLLEAVKARVKVVPHEDWNPKITTWKDYELAKIFLEKKEDTIWRTGFGRDTHRLASGRKLFLGSLHIPCEKGALGHSDGDALLHAIADAMLGAIGAGDIGEWFPDTDPRYKNARSTKMMQPVLQEAGRKGWNLEHVDSVIILERPKLGPYKRQIRRRLADLLTLNEDAVSVKAKTMEGLGPEGAGLAVTCEAMVTMRKKNETL